MVTPPKAGWFWQVLFFATKPWWFTQEWAKQRLARHLSETPDHTWITRVPYLSTRGWNIVIEIGAREYNLGPYGRITTINA